MSSLGISLLILVVLCVGGVVGYNVWFMRRQRASATRLEDESHDEQRARAEPSLGMDQEPTAAAPFFEASGSATAGTASPPAAGANEAAAGGARSPAAEIATVTAAATAAMSTASSRATGAGAASITQPDTGEHESARRAHEQNAAPGAIHDGAGDAQTARDGGFQPDGAQVANLADAGAPAHPSQAELAPLANAAPENADAADAIDATSADSDQANEDGNADQANAPAEGSGRIPARELSKFECVVDLAPLADVPGERLLQLTRDMQRVGGKPIVIEASASGNAPETIRNGQAYQLVRFSLLLANRNGPLNAMEYSEFVSHVQRVADELDVLADVPDMNHVLVRSRELNNEVNALDAQVAVNVETKEALTPADLERLAGRFDLSEQGNNLYVRLGPDRAPVFSVALGSQPNRMVLLLDVPRVGRTGQPIRKMVECAWNCAQAYEGKMVDDGGHPIDNDLFDRIESQLETHYQALLGAGLPAGSTLARRVFN